MSESRVPFHLYAELFPRLSFAESAVRSGAIGREGLLEAITLYQGKILDGRERYLGCLAKHVTPRFQEYAGECGSPLEFVVSKNVRRRHLTDGQRALIAAKLRLGAFQSGPAKLRSRGRSAPSKVRNVICDCAAHFGGC